MRSDEHDEEFRERWWSILGLFFLYVAIYFGTALVLWLILPLSWSQAMGGAALPAFCGWVLYLELERRR